MLRAYLAEGLGTFALLFGVVGAIAGRADPLGVILLNGIIIAAMIAALGPVSGAHFNPAVTLGMLVTRRISPVDAVGYWMAQLLGAAVGVWVVALGKEPLKAVHFAVPTLSSGLSTLAGVGVEGVLTFLLVLVIVATAIHTQNPAAASYIGLAVALGVMAGANLTGGTMNPARAFGSAIWAGESAVQWIYWVGPLLGGVLGTITADWLYQARKVTR